MNLSALFQRMPSSLFRDRPLSALVQFLFPTNFILGYFLFMLLSPFCYEQYTSHYYAALWAQVRLLTYARVRDGSCSPFCVTRNRRKSRCASSHGFSRFRWFVSYLPCRTCLAEAFDEPRFLCLMWRWISVVSIFYVEVTSYVGSCWCHNLW